MKNKPFLFLLTLLSFNLIAAEQFLAFKYGGKNYYSDTKDLWSQEATGEKFKVNKQIITVKAAANYTAFQRNIYLQDNNLTLLRTAITGYSDLKLPANADYEEVLFSLKDSGFFSVVEATTFGRYTFIPNDTQYASQWHLPMVNAPTAWDLTTGSASVVVAVLDSGTEFTHSDLGDGSDGFGNIWINSGEDAWSDPNDPSTGNGIDDDNNGFIDDWKGWNFDAVTNDGSGSFFHGTAVAGVVAAKTNNAIGVAGVAGGNNSPGVSIMINNVGSSAPNGAVLDDAILYAAANGAKIIQMSLSVGSSQAIDDAIAEAYINQGLLIINAAGNSGDTFVGYPASHANVMAIGASNQSDFKASFSQYGTDLEVSAPGVSIVTTDLNNDYLSTSGTSFSAPLTSGIAGLIFSKQPSLNNIQVRDILRNSADKVGGYNYNHDITTAGHSLEMGYGRVNALAALQLADSVVTAGLPNVIFENSFESDILFANGFE